MMSKQTGFGFASSSVTRHLLRGVIGFGALIGSFALYPVIGFVSLVLLPVGFLALRGCPTCWLIGLIETISAGRLKRSCVDGSCVLSAAGQTRAAQDEEPYDLVAVGSRSEEPSFKTADLRH
jgi:hypothetical protein